MKIQTTTEYLRKKSKGKQISFNGSVYGWADEKCGRLNCDGKLQINIGKTFYSETCDVCHWGSSGGGEENPFYKELAKKL